MPPARPGTVGGRDQGGWLEAVRSGNLARKTAVPS